MEGRGSLLRRTDHSRALSDIERNGRGGAETVRGEAMRISPTRSANLRSPAARLVTRIAVPRKTGVEARGRKRRISSWFWMRTPISWVSLGTAEAKPRHSSALKVCRSWMNKLHGIMSVLGLVAFDHRGHERPGRLLRQVVLAGLVRVPGTESTSEDETIA